jgi:hypothetical protein
MITAINKRNQTLVNKATKWLVRYNEANDLRDKADNSGDERTFKKLEKVCEKAFNEYLEVCLELPKREIAQIEKLLY